MYYFGKENWRTLERGIEKEWLVTNGIGGYASSTIVNLNTRKYHGLLVAAHNPPGFRVLHLTKLDERFQAGSCTYNLAANDNRSGFAEYGFIHLQQVSVEPLPTFTYSFGDITLVKTIFMAYGRNTTVIHYQARNGAEPAVLTLVPLVNCRGHHYITTQGEINFTQQLKEGGVSIKGREEIPPLLLSSSSGGYIPGDSWYAGMAYAAERERGENPYEDHYIPGRFEIPFAPGESKTFTVVASTEDIDNLDGEELLAAERRHLQGLARQAGYDDHLARRLVRAADAFIVERRSTGKKTVIAGYPWFADWGRDAMIALPGLALVTKRFDDAREVLLTFAKHRRRGLLPNAFFDGAREPVYNAVDASLWFVHAVYKYLNYTKDLDFVREQLYPVVKDIVHWYMTGTDFNIGMDSDGLISAGSPDIQLTWMDAKVDQWVVTPRHGKAVEINALWYNSVCILNMLSSMVGESPAYPELPARIKDNFIKCFWNEENHYLNDVITPDGPEDGLRPNQLMAVSLPYTMLTQEMGRSVVQRVWQELYLTYGIRSLSPFDERYQGVYLGDRLRRDGAYHQGTAWSWLIGPFITAYRRVNNYSPESRVQARRFILPFRDQLRDHGVGYISEIFDADEPAMPRGCIAQAWGVAEVLRALVEDVLEIQPIEETSQYRKTDW
ncbi:Amylo-alpha-1,6-glucosidase [Pelotomaculum schinkii]|uniref:Amylo-alpha-1,6-glucosidase n=1 Tax=Pelotomaculum schinkii TaxID=78350 RepID=A0A4Y7R5T7_9FIRM|nr:amylo-alpha-1,6-glucosidase [Pelotomaculum schinkii]TEB04334.1 Amylo-alpha-1,6-glucosidase [Pelotomaculum schinkii]